MPISIQCPQCEARFQVPDNLAGRRGKCKACGAVITVPAAEAAEELAADVVVAEPVPAKTGSPPAAGTNPPQPARQATPPRPPQERQQEILAAFQGEIAPVRVPLTYRLGILLVTVVMVLLPLIYIALIALVCWAVYLHMVNDTGMLGAARGRAALIVLLAYLAPLIVGCILIFFMFKPLLARAPRPPRRRALQRGEEPILFAFVDRICAAVKAPRPKRIDLDCQVNASASFRRGFWSMLLGNDLVLTVGMPLVAGLSMQQLAGVLAHEFGHFSQGLGMRLTYVIRSISFWFTRVVYERDSWDEWLARSAEGLDFRISWVLYLAQFFVWLTRRVLWVLMMIGHAVAGYMLRQMEFDADRYEARLAGSSTFEATMRGINELSLANQKSHADLEGFYREGRLGDNLPKLVDYNVAQIPDELKQQLRQATDQSQTGWLDTHPADRDRIASAHREAAAGIFHSDQPAAALFVNYDEHCRGVTLDFYRNVFGPKFKPAEIHPLEDLLVREERAKGDAEALRRYFLDSFNMLRPLRLPPVALAGPFNAQEGIATIPRCRRRMLDACSAYRTAFAAFDQADTRLLQASAALALHSASLSIDPKMFEIPVETSGAAARTCREQEAELTRLEPELESFEEALGLRLVTALRLLFESPTAAQIEHAQELQHDTQRLLPALQTLNGLLTTARSVRDCKTNLALLFGHLQKGGQQEAAIAVITEQANVLVGQLRVAQDRLRGDLPYPFDHAQADMTLGRFLLPAVPPASEIGEAYEAGDNFLDRLADVYPRVTSRLANVAEQVEAALGLTPLEVPAAGS